MRILTALIQSGLIGAVVYVGYRVIRAEVEDRRWWKSQLARMESRSAWKP